jgi:hypothetical protein
MKSVLAAAAVLSAGCFVADGGDMHASWSITQGTTASNCAAIGGDTVEILATRITGSHVYQEFFDCEDYNATIYDMRPGTYDVEVNVFDINGAQLSEPFAVGVRVFSGEIVEAGNFEFSSRPGTSSSTSRRAPSVKAASRRRG